MKIKKILLMFILIFLTGCSKFDMDMSIKNNRSMDYKIKILSKTDYNFEDKVIELKNKLGDSYDVGLYNESGYSSGIYISKHYNDIDYISLGERSDEYNLLYFYNNPYSEAYENKMFNIDKSIDTNRYAANFYIDLSEYFTSLDSVNVTFNLSVPNGTLSNNASSVSDDGKNLIWNLNKLGKNDIDFVFEITSYDSLYQLGAIIIAIFLVFMIFTKLLSKSGDVSDSSDELTRDYDSNIRVNNLTRNAVRNNTPNAYNVNNNNQESININNNLNNNKEISNNIDNSNTDNNVDPKMFGLVRDDNVIKNEFNDSTNTDTNTNVDINTNTNINTGINTDMDNDVNNNQYKDNVSFNDIAISGNEEVIKFNNKDVVITKKKDDEE